MIDYGGSAMSGMLCPVEDTARRQAVVALVGVFAEAHPDIDYDFAWDSDTVNAQAFLSEERRRCVRIYGGLLRHRDLGLAGLALALAHETGHHKGGPPHDRYYSWLSCDCQADYWAASFGMAAIHRDSRRARHQAIAGAYQLTDLMQLGLAAEPGAAWFDSSGGGGIPKIPTPEMRLKTFLAGAIGRPRPSDICPLHRG